ncbi:hypothetical protein Tco_0564310 [Tanacetum coccineum]
MEAVEVPQTLEYRGGQLNAAPILEGENFTNWKKRFMCHILGVLLTKVDRSQSSRVPTPFLEDLYEAIRQACLVKTNTESEPSEDPIDTKTPESPYAVASPTPLPNSTPPACHTKESEDSDTSGKRSTSSDSTTPLSPDHPLTRTLPTPTPTHASFHRRTARVTVHTQLVMSLGHSARVAEAMALLDLALRKSEEDEIEEEDINEDKGHGLNDEGHGLDDKGHSLDDEGQGLDDEGHRLDDEGRSVKSDGLGLEGEEEAVPEGQQRVVLVMGEIVSAPLGLRYGVLRRPELAVEEDQVYSTFEIGQGSRSVIVPERTEIVSALRKPTVTMWIHPVDAPSAIPSPISSPMRSLTILSPIASLVATPIATILRLDVMPPTLFASIDKDVRELYTRALWKLVLALKAWTRHVGTRMADMSRAGYDDHRLVHDMLVQQATLQNELQEIRGRVTTLEQEKDRREQ